MNYTLHSGGAKGADDVFRQVAEYYGITEQYHYYYGEQSEYNSPYGNTHISIEDYQEGQTKMAESAKFLYGYPYKKINDVRICRNWCQIKYSNTVYAVGQLKLKGDKFNPSKPSDTRTLTNDCVIGGTGYAVARAILDNKPIYVFDQVIKQWFTFNYDLMEWEYFEGIPPLDNNFAGIGTRDINQEGIQAIIDLFDTHLNQSHQ